MQRYAIYKAEPSGQDKLALGNFVANYTQLPAAQNRVAQVAGLAQWGAILVDTRTGLWDLGDGWQDPTNPSTWPSERAALEAIEATVLAGKEEPKSISLIDVEAYMKANCREAGVDARRVLHWAQRVWAGLFDG